jgi:negative regulator of flagellin synthesis FlgM
MKVGSKIGPSPQGTQGVQAPKSNKAGENNQAENKAGGIAAKLGDTARVNLSERAQQMQRAKEIASIGADSVDEAKVARLQRLIDEGKYKVDAKAVADRLVDEHLAMGEE